MDPVQVGNDVVWIAGVIMAIWGVLGIIQKIGEIIKKPEKNQNERISILEEQVKELKGEHLKFFEFFANDKARIDSITKGNSVMQKALLALLSNTIDGNNINEMKAARTELQEYLIERKVN